MPEARTAGALRTIVAAALPALAIVTAVAAALTAPGAAAAVGAPAAPGSPAADATPVAGAAPAAGTRAIAITLDDLPGVGEGADLGQLRDMNRRILAALRGAGAPAIGFVNEGRLQVRGERDARAGILRDWLDAGMDLGNHTFAHRGLTGTPLADYQDDVMRGEVVTRALLEERGRGPIFFRHPFTQTGPTPEIKAAFEEFLAARGYRVAPFTIEDADYIFDALYRAALEAGDAARAAGVRDEYAAHQARMLDWYEGLARALFGRDIAQVLLIHVNTLNADTLGARLAALVARGYRFVTLDEALADPACATPDRYVGSNGPSWLHRWSVALGAPPRLKDEPDPPARVLAEWRDLEARRAAGAP